MTHRREPDAYWDAYADTLVPPTDAAARNLAALRRRIEAGEVIRHSHSELASADGGTASDSSRFASGESFPVEARSRWVAGLFLYAKAGALSVGLGLSGLAAIHGAATVLREPAVEPVPGPSEQQQKTPARSRRGDAAAGSSPSVMSVPEEAATEPGVSPPPVPSVRARSKVPRGGGAAQPSVTNEAQDADALRAELELMRRAESALQAGQETQLLRILEQHRVEHRQGAMVEEREAWTAVGACRLQRADARRLVEAFVRRFPRSAQRPAVARACKSIVDLSVMDPNGSSDEQP